MSNLHRKCAKCGRTRAEDMTVTYHRFPNPGMANITKSRAWAIYCWPDGDWSSLECLHSLYITNKVLCGRHFHSSQFYDNKRQNLSKFAVPDSTEVKELLNEENVFNVNVEHSYNTGQRESRMPFSQRENIATMAILAKTSVAVPETSKSSGNDNNRKLLETRVFEKDCSNPDLPPDIQELGDQIVHCLEDNGSEKEPDILEPLHHIESGYEESASEHIDRESDTEIEIDSDEDSSDDDTPLSQIVSY